MKRFLVLIALLVAVAPAHAGLLVEEIGDDTFFVSYERGRWTSATILDTAAKARRKLEKLSHRYCLEEGYGYVRFLSLAEISRDEDLRAVWEMAAGDEASDSYQIAGDDPLFINKAHKTRRIVRFSTEPKERFEVCEDR
ncbi:MAG: hypothetical protein P8Y44_10860 [Acidobacteriota bacterium]